jgi:DNA-binding transcriptional ArsR family regulator
MKPGSLTPAMLGPIARRFRLLGEPLRLHIVQSLMAGEKAVSEIVEATEASQSNVSKHLHALTAGGLLGRRRVGNSVYYFIADRVVFKLCDLMCASARRDARARLLELQPRKTA